MEIQQQPKTSGLAIASLVTSLLGLGLVAVICGHIALSKIKRSAGALTGSGLATAGLVIGYVSMVLMVLIVIPVMFIGARAWKKGSDRAGCIINQRNVQKAVRDYQAINHLKPGDRIDWSKIPKPAGSTNAASASSCPAGGVYTFSETIPATGVLVVECPNAAADHAPSDHSTW